MKKIIILLLSSAVCALGQQVGLSLGTAMFDPAINDIGDVPVPKNLCGHFQFSFNEDLKINLSGGYGYERSYTSSTNYLTQTYYVSRFKITGVPVELDLQYSKPMVILSGIRPFIGLGFGYYNYSVKHTTEQTGSSFESKTKMDGTAQYFTFGLDYKMGKRLSAFIQFKKIGLSKMTIKDPYYTNVWYAEESTSEKSLSPQPGLDDLSMTIGILFKLRPRHEVSIEIE
jgi:outer membrane protein W